MYEKSYNFREIYESFKMNQLTESKQIKARIDQLEKKIKNVKKNAKTNPEEARDMLSVMRDDIEELVDMFDE